MNERDTKSGPPLAAPEPEPDAEAQAPAEPGFSLEDTMTQKLRGVPIRSRSGVVGYNPYDAEPAAKGKPGSARPKPTDLRKLSEWIRLQRQVAELNADAPQKKPPKPD